MTDLMSHIWQSIGAIELVAVIFGLAYTLLAAKENILCWYAALINTTLSIYLFWDASLLMESALNIYYLVIAVYGWRQWKYGSNSSQPSQPSQTRTQDTKALTISSWGWQQHLCALVLVTVLTLISGALLDKNTSAAMPYLDSFTTWGAVITTWMMTRKVLENWLYWIVVDGLAMYLYASRDLYLYALLSAVYTIIVCFGYYQWRKTLTQAQYQ